MQYTLNEKLGDRQTGFLVSKEDMKYRPLSKCRMEVAWLHSDNGFGPWDMDKSMGQTFLIPMRHFMKITTIEQEGELGIDLINRYLETI